MRYRGRALVAREDSQVAIGAQPEEKTSRRGHGRSPQAGACQRLKPRNYRIADYIIMKMFVIFD